MKMNPAGLILVVDDEPLIRYTLSKALTRLGYEVALAESGADALQQVTHLNPDVILLDVLMPDLDGFEVCRRLRALPRLAEAPIIMITGLDDRDARLACLRAGADDFMRKPVDRLELEVRLHNILSLNRYRHLSQEKARFARLAELAPTGIVISDPDGRLLFANPAAQTLFASVPVAADERPLFPLNRHATRQEIAWRDRDGRLRTVELSVIDTQWEDQAACLALLNDITARKAAEQEREALHRQLLDVSRQAGMAEAAIGVLHNVGNVLNSVTVSAGLIADELHHSRLPTLHKALGLLREMGEQDASPTANPRFPQVLDYLDRLAGHLTGEQQRLLAEFQEIHKRIDHIKVIINQQQAYAFSGGTAIEQVVVAQLLDDTIAMHLTGQEGIEVQRDYVPLAPMACEKHKLLQILVNLIRNACQAVKTSSRSERWIQVSIAPCAPDRLRIAVSDNGIGIAPDHLTRVFEFGFTTKAKGHGFGLHTSANLAREMGGALHCHSDGPGCGTTFTLELPLTAAEASIR